jgi:hypothetical protein
VILRRTAPVACVLALGAFLAACGGDAEPAATPEHAPVFVQGSVTGVDDAHVVVTLMADTADDLEVGDVIESFDLATADVDDDGEYVVEVDPAVEIPVEFVESESFVNFKLLVIDGDEVKDMWNSTVTRVEQGGETVWRSDEYGGDLPLRLDFDLDQHETTETNSDGKVEGADTTTVPSP